MTTLAEVIQNAVSRAVAQAKLDAHPVGSLYWSAEPDDPAGLFGGVWERVKDRFILAAGDDYAAGSEGGEATHTLTLAESPAHTHYDDNNPAVQGRNFFVSWGTDGAKDWSGTRVSSKTWGAAVGYTKDQWGAQGPDTSNQFFAYQTSRTVAPSGGGGA